MNIGFLTLCDHLAALFPWKATNAGVLLFGVPLLAAVYATSQCLRWRRPAFRPPPRDATDKSAPLKRAESLERRKNTSKAFAFSSSASSSSSSSRWFRLMVTANDVPLVIDEAMCTDDTQSSCVVLVAIGVQKEEVPAQSATSTPSWIRRRRKARKRRDAESIKRAQARAYMRQRQQPDENTLFEVENSRMPEIDLTAQFYAKLRANQTADDRFEPF